MNLTQFVPTGRTSLIKKSGADLQIQTEYAYRPYARLTTTIIHNGQVLHKIEKKLEKPIESFEEQSIMEARMQRQHADVVGIIKDNDTSSLMKKSDSQKIKIQTESEGNKKDDDQSEPASTHETVVELKDSYIPQEDLYVAKFKGLAGVQYVYHLNLDGEFVNKIESDHFKKTFSAVFKSISELIEIFTLLPGVTFSRECGVYEVERNKLYLVSAGEDIYFVMLANASKDINYEKELKAIVTPSYF